jgi:potassium efflux system protein
MSVVAQLVALRWLSRTRRKIAWKLALQEHDDESKRRARGKARGREIPVAESEPIDLDAVDQQTRRLLRAGLGLFALLGTWGIWSEVLPALSILQEVSLWSQAVTTDGQELVIPVTLADILLALVVIVVTIVASKNLPGLMEIALLQRLNLETGSRYALNTLMRYFCHCTRRDSRLRHRRLELSQIQWLVAALSVGLGFGLQESVANFVSGLIILFERPVRVGDTVSVGEMTGTVSRLQIRATTVMDWDRKEIIVPNKSLITQPVVNWTLSDRITRIVVPIGVACRSDVSGCRSWKARAQAAAGARTCAESVFRRLR